jgi:hypothetical protein
MIQKAMNPLADGAARVPPASGDGTDSSISSYYVADRTSMDNT